jgi:hypothetical protein
LLIANSGKMLITFSSNSTTQGLGWSAKYWTLKNGDGIHENDYEKISVYPNPVSSEMIINNQKSIHGAIVVSIFDYSGKEVYTMNQSKENSDPIKIDVSNLEAGFYIVSVQSENHSYRAKFIKL